MGGGYGAVMLRGRVHKTCTVLALSFPPKRCHSEQKGYTYTGLRDLAAAPLLPSERGGCRHTAHIDRQRASLGTIQCVSVCVYVCAFMGMLTNPEGPPYGGVSAMVVVPRGRETVV